MRILVVDDDVSLLKALARLMESWGARADCASDALEAVKKAREAKYDFVLLDVRMPHRDAVWFMQHVRTGKTTKVIAMSGFVPGTVLRRLYELGVCAYIEKPFTPDDLMSLLELHAPRAVAETSTAPALVRAMAPA